MQLPRYATCLLHTALLLLVLGSAGSIHSHLCLDGQEPALSVHFENLNGHPEHDGDEVHVDLENELAPQGLPGKAPDQGSQLFLTAFSLLLCLRLPQRPLYVLHDDADFHQASTDLLPPLRAPPAHSS